MPGNMKKPGARRTYKKPGEMVLQPVPLPSGSRRKMNPLDKAIMKQRRLKSRNKNPGRYLDK